MHNLISHGDWQVRAREFLSEDLGFAPQLKRTWQVKNEDFKSLNICWLGQYLTKFYINQNRTQCTVGNW